MSYILEALKKSDQQRQQGAAPTLTSVQLPVEEMPERTFPWLVALTAVVFVGGILVGWLQPWKGEQPAALQPAEDQQGVQAPQTSSASAAPVVNAPPDVRTDLARNQAQIPAPKPLPVAPLTAAPAPQAVQPKQMPAAVLEDLPASAVAAPVVAAPQPVATTAAKPARPAAVTAERSPAAIVKAPAITEQNVMTKAELPAAIQQELPTMSVSLHAYSGKASNRLVGINDKLLQEGDALAPGLVLEEITRKDMIFTYKGYRFRQGVQQ